MGKRTPPDDVILPVARASDGALSALRYRANSDGDRDVSVTVLRPLEDGVAVRGDIVSAHRLGDSQLYRLETEVPFDNRGKGDAGKLFSIPSEAFARGWERIWGESSPLPSPDDEDTIVH